MQTYKQEALVAQYFVNTNQRAANAPKTWNSMAQTKLSILSYQTYMSFFSQIVWRSKVRLESINIETYFPIEYFSSDSTHV